MGCSTYCRPLTLSISGPVCVVQQHSACKEAQLRPHPARQLYFCLPVCEHRATRTFLQPYCNMRAVTSLPRCCTIRGHAWSAGGYELEEHAAEAYDVAALKCKGSTLAKVNFDLQRCAMRRPCC